MSITKQEVIRRLGAVEPKYTELAKMGPEAVPHLAALINGEDLGFAAKATYLASVIQTDEAIDALSVAATSPHRIVRVAAAAGLGNVRDPRAISLAQRLLDDEDAGVRKFAVRAASRLGLSELEPKVRAIAIQDNVPALRQIAAGALQSIPANGYDQHP
jgi:HEAT repeat protein